MAKLLWGPRYHRQFVCWVCIHNFLIRHHHRHYHRKVYNSSGSFSSCTLRTSLGSIPFEPSYHNSCFCPRILEIWKHLRLKRKCHLFRCHFGWPKDIFVSIETFKRWFGIVNNCRDLKQRRRRRQRERQKTIFLIRKTLALHVS